MPSSSLPRTSAHLDRFSIESLPGRETWPSFEFLAPPPEFLNAAEELIDGGSRRFGRQRMCLRTDSGDTWTFGELNDLCNQLANTLVNELGLVPGNRVLLRGGNTPALVATWLAVVKAGCVVITTLPTLRPAELRRIAAEVEPRVAISDSRHLSDIDAALGDSINVYALGGGGARDLLVRAAGHSARFSAVSTRADDVVLLAPTSGTMGAPKITMHFHRDVLAIADTVGRYLLQPRADDIVIGTPPIAFTFGLGGLLVFPLRFGITAVLLDRQSPQDLAEQCVKTGATLLFTVPTAYRAIIQLGLGAKLSGVRVAISSGEELDARTWRMVHQSTGLRVINAFGATEMLHAFIATTDAVEERPGSMGHPIPGYRVAVLNESGSPVPPGEIGRLAAIGPTGCRYLHGDHQADHVRDGWNVFSDLVRQEPDGSLWYEGRSDAVIVTAGYNVSAREVESALARHDDVVECAVVGRPDPDRGMIVQAFVVLRDSSSPGDGKSEELRTFVRSQLAPYKAPRRIEIVAALPRNPHGKVDYAHLLGLVSAQAAQSAADAGEGIMVNSLRPVQEREASSPMK